MNDVVRLILHTSVMAKGVLIILAFLSMISWAIIFEKIIILAKARSESMRFKWLLEKGGGWDSLFHAVRSFKASPFPLIYRKAYSALNSLKRGPAQDDGSSPGNEKISPDSLKQIMSAATTEYLSRLDSRISVLSITVSVSPFLGLFGTVWGIMDAFINIGKRGSADLQTVGPGMAEALITTVAGLAVAIPALIAYNLIASRLRKLEDQAEVFTADLMHLFEKEKLT